LSAEGGGHLGFAQVGVGKHGEVREVGAGHAGKHPRGHWADGCIASGGSGSRVAVATSTISTFRESSSSGLGSAHKYVEVDSERASSRRSFGLAKSIANECTSKQGRYALRSRQSKQDFMVIIFRSKAQGRENKMLMTPTSFAWTTTVTNPRRV